MTDEQWNALRTSIEEEIEGQSVAPCDGWWDCIKWVLKVGCLVACAVGPKWAKKLCSCDDDGEKLEFDLQHILGA